MQIQTRGLDEIEVDEGTVLTLTEPMPGFPGHHRFALLTPDPEIPFRWFRAVDRPDLCFLVADPRYFFPDYGSELASEALGDLELCEGAEAVVAVVVTPSEDSGRVTANLRAPLVFNPERGLARQVILEDAGHRVRTPLIGHGRRACQPA
ncbi:MAG: flagellar assembly protein FliW [Deferrisomatales bacterium]|nr:flagellar assembly protein FliW [Deferrisomatales bacterium]